MAVAEQDHGGVDGFGGFEGRLEELLEEGIEIRRSEGCHRDAIQRLQQPFPRSRVAPNGAPNGLVEGAIQCSNVAKTERVANARFPQVEDGFRNILYSTTI